MALSMLLALFPFLSAALICYVWLRKVSPIMTGQVNRLLAASLLTLSQITSISLVAGLAGHYNALVVYGLNALATYLVWRRTHVANKLEPIPWWGKWTSLTRPNQTVLIVVGLLTLCLIVKSVFSSDTSFDAMSYHLPWVNLAVQTGGFGPFDFPVLWIDVYPKLLHLWYGWYLLLPANDFLVDLMQLPFALLGILASYSILRKLRYSLNTAFPASAVLLFLPVVVSQATINYIDVAIAALSLMAFHFALQKPTAHKYWLLGLVGALLLGAKASNLLILLAALVIAATWDRREPRPRRPFAAWLRTVAPALLLPLLLPSYWYVQNWRLFGSPLYPIRISLGSLTILDGLLPTTELLGKQMPAVLLGQPFWQQLFTNSYAFGTPTYDMSPGGFGLVWGFLLLPLMIPAVLSWIQRRAYAPFGLFIGIWLIWLSTPGNWWLRYVILLSFSGSLALAEVIERSGKRYYLQTWLPLTLIILGLLSVYPALLFTSLDASNRHYEERFGPVFGSLDSHTQAGTTIATDSHLFVLYPLWNKTRSNEVVYLPWQSQWEAKLGANSVDLIIGKPDSPELQYIQSHAKDFRPILRDDKYQLWEIK